VQAARAGDFGKITRAEAYSPAHLEPTHPDLFWYGIHGCEALYTVMGPGCETVTRGKTADGLIEVTGQWTGGRTGIFREGNAPARAQTETGEDDLGKSDGYRPLIAQIVKMFRTKQVPIAPAETIELYAFMEAADESKRQGGAEVKIADVMAQARPLAEKRLAELDAK
jgi:hypothetical protein